MIETFDTDKDGEIDYPEFLAMMRANNKELQARRGPGACLRRRACGRARGLCLSPCARLARALQSSASLQESPRVDC
jgi:hypothetical protein